MAEVPEFQKKQYAFAAHIRDPDNVTAPAAIEDRRMAIYRELFFNNLYKLLGSTFPVLRKIYKDSGWSRLVRAFMAHHQAETPYFLEISREFIAFLQDGYDMQAEDPPFLLELAHYEWAEMALSVSDAVDELDGIDPDGDLLAAAPCKSVLAWSLAYRFPVHRIEPSFQPQEPGEQATFIAIYRKADDELGFMELNPLTAQLLDRIEHNSEGKSGRELLLSLAEELNYPDAEALVGHGGAALTGLRAAGILLGTRR
jgi:uncharacterized protein